MPPRRTFGLLSARSHHLSLRLRNRLWPRWPEQAAPTRRRHLRPLLRSASPRPAHLASRRFGPVTRLHSVHPPHRSGERSERRNHRLCFRPLRDPEAPPGGLPSALLALP
eukprot:scaffold1397_cov254-Pinguiococcus_pyrenoidosus.AAC.36